MTVLTTLDGGLRLDGGSLVLSSDAAIPCCCGCDPAALQNATLVFTTVGVSDVPAGSHRCNCAIFDIYINGNFFNQINHNNLNDGLTRANTFNNVNLSVGAVTQDSCCLVFIKLDCAIPPTTSDPTCQSFKEVFGVPCHVSITDVKVTLNDGRVFNLGLLGNGVNSPLLICPLPAEPMRMPMHAAKSDSSPPPPGETCKCCTDYAVQCERLQRNKSAGVATALNDLVSKFFFRGGTIMHTPERQKYIAAADRVPFETWEKNVETLVMVLRVLALEFGIEFDSKRASILARRAISLAKASAQKNG